jgi:hypothetical protein
MMDATNTTQQDRASQAEAWAATLSDLIDGNKQALAQWFRGTETLSDETLALARARMLLAMEAWSAFLACRSPEQVVEQQSRFLAKAMDRCAEEMTMLSQLARRTASHEPSS